LTLALTLATAGALTLPVAAQPPGTTYEPRPLNRAQVRTDIALLRQSLEQVHSGYDRYVPRRIMDSAFARLDRRAEAPMTDLQLYREVALLLARIRCNHTKAEYPAALEAYRRQNPTHLPVRVRVFGTKLYVAQSADRTIERGTEILSINGSKAADVITSLSRFAAVDGFTDFSRAALLERDSDLMGSDLDHYWPVEYGFASAWDLSLKDARGVARRLTLAPISYAAWLALEGPDADTDFRSGTSWTMLDDSTAQLRLRSFVNYRTPIDADSLYRTLFAQFAERNAKHLVIDLRENGGGSDDASSGLVRYLADTLVRPVRAVRRRTINIDSSLAAAFDTWGDRAPIFSPRASLFDAQPDGWFVERLGAPTLRPAPTAFTGRVSVLIGRSNSSGSTMLLAVLQEIGSRTGRLRLVGEETGGSAEGPTAGQILFLRLPNSGMRVRVPLKRSDVNVSTFFAGLGVFPDIDATETLADFRAGIDRALTTARTTPWRLAPSPHSPAVGLMRGELEYRDYSSGRQVLLPTSVHLSPMGTSGSFRQRIIYDDGPDNTIYSSDELRVVGDRWIEGNTAAGGETAEGQTTFRIVSRRQTAEGLQLVLRGRGMDDGKPVEFRYTVTIGASASKRLKEFRLPGKPWEYRHEYRFRRADETRK
jgi:hypothetical protein